MKERARELKAAARRGGRAAKADGESAVLAKIAEMPEPDRAIAERLHAVIKASAPALVAEDSGTGCPRTPRTARSSASSKRAQKFKTRYATFGFNDDGEPRRRHHVADRVRADGVDRRRRGKNRRAREESGELRIEQAAGPRPILREPVLCLLMDRPIRNHRPIRRVRWPGGNPSRVGLTSAR